MKKSQKQITINMKSVLREAGNAQCYDASKIIQAFDLAESKGWTAGQISPMWMERIHGWKSFNAKAIQTTIERSKNWPGNYVVVPQEILNILGATKPTRKTKATKAAAVATPTASASDTQKPMNLRTLLHNCYENKVYDVKTALDILQNMKNSGYDISDQDIDFAQGWKKFSDSSFKTMVENTYKGTNKFVKRELFECTDFESFLPLSKTNGAGKTLNVRTVLNKFYEDGCTDAIKILATLNDLEAAGYEGVEAYNVPGLANKTSEEVRELLAEAHAGVGYFEGMDLLDCPNF